MTEEQLRALGWSAAEAKQIMALPIDTRYFDLDDLPLSVTARWNDDYPMGLEVRAWHGSSSRPYPTERWWEARFLKAMPQIDRREFDDLRALIAEFAA
jgi:hypothetical protein